jgi:hypothetical protein
MRSAYRVAGVLSLFFAACGPSSGGDELPDEGETCDNVTYTYLNDALTMNGNGVLAGRDADTGFHEAVVVPTEDGMGTTIYMSPGIGIGPESCLWLEAQIGIWEGPDFRRVDAVPTTATTGSTTYDAHIPITFNVPVNELVSDDASITIRFNMIDGRWGETYMNLRLVESTVPVPDNLATGCLERYAVPRTIELLRDPEVDGEPLTVFDATKPAELLWGFQGSPMITPKLRLSNPSAAPEQCVTIALYNDIAGEVTRGLRGSYRLTDDGSGLVSGYLYNEMLGSAANETVGVRAVVFGPGFRSEQLIDVPVVDAE